MLRLPPAPISNSTNGEARRQRIARKLQQLPVNNVTPVKRRDVSTTYSGDSIDQRRARIVR
jgi:hypothetical protein